MNKLVNFLKQTKKLTEAEKYLFDILIGNAKYEPSNFVTISEQEGFANKDIIFNNGIVRCHISVSTKTLELEKLNLSNIFINEKLLWNREDKKELKISDLFEYLD